MVMKKESRLVSLLENAHAVVVGVGDYLVPPRSGRAGFLSLPATVSDALAIERILCDPTRCGYRRSHVLTITGESADVIGVRGALRELSQSVTTECTVLVYFSGHGAQSLRDGSWHTYICTRDADPEDLSHTAISGEELSTAVAAISARRILVILDACHAAGSAPLKHVTADPTWKRGLSDVYLEKLGQGAGRVVIASSREDQDSYLRPQGDLSLFTFHLLEALRGQAAIRGDGLIHVLDIFHYVSEMVQADRPEQTPVLKAKDLDLNFPVALALDEKENGSLTDIRELIVRSPNVGANALSDYLFSRQDSVAQRNEVDLKRAELERLDREEELFGPAPELRHARNRAIYCLLRICLAVDSSR
jgi:metacaspase-1